MALLSFTTAEMTSIRIPSASLLMSTGIRNSAASGQRACSLELTISTVAASVVARPITARITQRITAARGILLPGFVSAVSFSICISLLASKPAGGVRRFA